MPLMTKKKGMNTPNATAVSFESNDGHLLLLEDLPRDQAGGEPAEQQVEAQIGGEQGQREHEHDDPADRELRALLDRLLEQRNRAVRRTDRDHGDRHGQGDERDQDQRVVQRALRRQDEREQQDRAELPDGPRREQIGAEPGAHLAGVGQDRQERADGGRREGRADVHERDDDARRGQRAAERVRDHQRHGPAVEGQAQRLAADARDVDLVAGEEEEHAEPEVREELRERVDVGEVEHLRSDDHAEGQLDHDDRDEQVASARHRDERRRHGRRHDDREERAGVDAERRRVRCQR